jgi:dsDNA-specific endonuclease/ATPase MutS2
VAQHAAGPLGAARIAARRPDTDATLIRESLAQVAELAALLITDDAIRAEPVPDIAPSLELLDVPGSVLEALPLAELTVALAAMRVTAADLKRIDTTHHAPRTVSFVRPAVARARNRVGPLDLSRW